MFSASVERCRFVAAKLATMSQSQTNQRRKESHTERVENRSKGFGVCGFGCAFKLFV